MHRTQRVRRWWLSLSLAVLSCCVGAQAAVAAPLTPIGAPLVTGISLSQVAFAPSGSLLAITNHAEQSVSMFSVSPTGTVAQIGTPTPTPDPHAPAFSPLGGLLATVDYDGYAASVFSVSPSGALAQIGTPSATEALPIDAEFSPDGRLLAVANSDSFSVSMYSVSAAGVLTEVASDSRDTISYLVMSVAFSPDGSRLAVLQEDDIVRVYSVSSIGALSLLGSADTGRYPLSVAYSPDGTLLATANTGGDSVSMFSVTATGAPIPVGSPTQTVGLPTSVAFSPRGNLLLATTLGDAANNNPSYSVSAFSVSPGGALTPSGSPTPTGGPPSMAFSPDGALLATTDGSAVSMYSVAAPALEAHITSGPAAATAATTATFAFDANHPARFECRLDAGSFAPCATPASYAELAPGTHTFAVRAKDLTGTFASSPASQSWTIDLKAPAQDSGPQPADAGVPRPGAAAVPRIDRAAITGLRLSRATFRAARSGAAVKAAAVGIGARVSYTLTAAARVRFMVQRRVRGASVSGRCVERTAGNRKRASCGRYVRVLGSSFTRDRPTGSDRFTFTARAGDRALSPGRYRLVATPAANGRTGTPVRARFRVAR